MNTLEIKQVSKRYAGKSVLDQVSLSIMEGELFFLLGPSGCGKTTLLRTIAGLVKPDSGLLEFNGRNLADLPVEKRNIGMVFQQYSLWPHMTVFENVAYGLKIRKAPRTEIKMRVEEALVMVGLAGFGDRKPGTLSGGEQQRAALARALVYKSELVLLDEPLSNLDAKLRKEMRSEIKRIHETLKVTMIYVTHDQEEASALASRMAFMREGRVVQVGTPLEIRKNPADEFTAEFFGVAVGNKK